MMTYDSHVNNNMHVQNYMSDKCVCVCVCRYGRMMGGRDALKAAPSEKQVRASSTGLSLKLCVTTGNADLICLSITDFFQRNLWQNVSVIVRHGLMNDHGSMLWWNLSAPCRLDGEVWPCHRGHGCREVEGFRQQLKGAWRQNSRGQWVRKPSNRAS